MERPQGKPDTRQNGVVPSKSDLDATGSWTLPLLGFALLIAGTTVGTMLLSGDAEALFGR